LKQEDLEHERNQNKDPERLTINKTSEIISHLQVKEEIEEKTTQ